MNQIFYAGIDVSKLKLDVALTHNGKEILSYATFENNLAGFKKLTSWVKKQSKKFKLVHYCMEATGIYSEEIAEYLQVQKNAIISIVNPAQIKAYGGSLLLRTKNDKVDSKMIACYVAINQPKATPETPACIKEFKKLVRHLDYMVDKRAREKTKLESVKNEAIALMVNDTIVHYSCQIEKTEKLIKELVKTNSQLNEDIKLLDSVPSIGFKTACIILTEIHYSSKDNLDVKSEIAHAGLAPQERTSGTSVRGKSKICKKGNSRLRACLYMPATSSIKSNSILGDFYRKLLNNKKCKMVALIAVMKKMLTIAIGVLKSQKLFDPNWAIKKQKEFAMAF